jgi:hypothetical protein
MRRSLAKLTTSALLVAAVAAPVAAATHSGRTYVEDRFVRAANRGDYTTVCKLYSRRYLKVSQSACRALYRNEETLFGPFTYRVVRRRLLANGHRRADLVLRRHASFVEFAREPAGWRIVAGGF